MRVWEVTIRSESTRFCGESTTYWVGASDIHVAARKGIKLARANKLTAPRVSAVKLKGDVDA